MTDYLDVDDLLDIAEAVTGGPPKVRDYGLLSSAAARPETSVFGQDAYPDLATKAAASLHSLCANHALIDGNKRLAWAAARMFVWRNTQQSPRPINTEDAVAFMLEVANGRLTGVDEIARGLRQVGVID